MAARAAALALSALIALGTAACAAAEPATLPPEVVFSVHQNRPDTEDRRLQVRISNSSPDEFTITSLDFSSVHFADAAAYEKAPTVIPSGRTIDLPVLLPEPVCDDTSDTTPARVEVEFELSDGRTGTSSVIPDDPLVQLDGISERDCLAATIAEVADIAAPDALRVDQSRERPVALVDLAITPTQAGGTFTIDAVDDTTLFALHNADADGNSALDTLPLNLRVSGDDPPRTLTITLVPARCDAHAVAEDKRGTLLPLRVTIENTSGVLYLSLGETVKGQLYDYLNDACPRR